MLERGGKGFLDLFDVVCSPRSTSDITVADLEQAVLIENERFEEILSFQYQLGSHSICGIGHRAQTFPPVFPDSDASLCAAKVINAIKDVNRVRRTLFVVLLAYQVVVFLHRIPLTFFSVRNSSRCRQPTPAYRAYIASVDPTLAQNQASKEAHTRALPKV